MRVEVVAQNHQQDAKDAKIAQLEKRIAQLEHLISQRGGVVADCKYCEGTGYADKMRLHTINLHTHQPSTSPCPVCQGKGKVRI